MTVLGPPVYVRDHRRAAGRGPGPNVADPPMRCTLTDQSVKGLIGEIVLEATDSLGLSTSWTASLFVNGEAGQAGRLLGRGDPLRSPMT